MGPDYREDKGGQCERKFPNCHCPPKKEGQQQRVIVWLAFRIGFGRRGSCIFQILITDHFVQIIPHKHFESNGKSISISITRFSDANLIQATRYAGRSRQSIADIEENLNEIFQDHPDSHINDDGQPVIPADALVDVFRAFSESYNGVELMTTEELDLLKMLLASNPGLEVTPQTLIAFIAEKTKHSPRESPNGSPQKEEDVDLPERGRTSDGDSDEDERQSRSSSRDSRRTASRPPSVPPKTPTNSVFDTGKRQRSTPLGGNAPSSWSKRPAPASRRKSVDGGRPLSDSEVSNKYIDSFCAILNVIVYSPQLPLHSVVPQAEDEPLQTQQAQIPSRPPHHPSVHLHSQVAHSPAPTPVTNPSPPM